MKHSTIQTETIDTLRNAAMQSPMAYAVRGQASQVENSFDLIRLLTTAFIAADEERAKLAREVANLKSTSPHIPPILLDKNQVFMGVDIAESGKDVGVYHDGKKNLPTVTKEMRYEFFAYHGRTGTDEEILSHTFWRENQER